ncbi:MAG: IS110 family transposase [Succinivibrio sp.]
MERIIYVGMDVHTTSYTLCAYADTELNSIMLQEPVKLAPNVESVERFIRKAREKLDACAPGFGDGPARVVCGYEAGCLGFSLLRQLERKGIPCVVMAPTTILAERGGRRVKTDKNDAEWLARSLCFGSYKPVYAGDDEDLDNRDYIRARNAQKELLKQTKQQILGFLHAQGHSYDGTPWTGRFFKWLKGLEMSARKREALNAYLNSYHFHSEEIRRMDSRIEEMAREGRYLEHARKLMAMKGIATNTAMSLLTEVGDFARFASADAFAAFLGLVPGEQSSGGSERRTGITKAGNSHLRRLLVESAHSFVRCRCAAAKSLALRKRQEGLPDEVVAYADRAARRLSHRARHLLEKNNKPYNVVVAAIAREMACFIWGMMNGQHRTRAEAQG